MERQILVALVDLTGESRPPPEVAQDVPGTDLWRRTGIMFQWHYIESILVLQIISSKGMCNQTSTECNTCIMIERASTEELRKRKTAPRWNIETLALQGKSCWDCVVREACTIINIKPVSSVYCEIYTRPLFLFVFPLIFLFSRFELHGRMKSTWMYRKHGKLHAIWGGTLLVTKFGR